VKFEWEKIHEQKEEKVFWFGTYRAKVFGGWIVRNFDLTKHQYNNLRPEYLGSTSESSVFVPDPNHKWEIE